MKTNHRAEVYRQARPKPDITFQDIQKATAFDPHKVDPRILRNRHIPVDPKIIEAKQKEYLEDLERWSNL